MPLHLLGKKSWNVYNPDNVARVRRDEARAKAQEEEEERRMQEVDAENRIKLLRGERPSNPLLPPALDKSVDQRTESYRQSDADLDKSRHRKRRRLAGENDTDRDIRFAKEDADSYNAKRDELLSSHRKDAERDEHVSITDSAGHINLFTEDMTRNKRAEKNVEAEAEKLKKKRALEDQYTMRFSNAAGFKESAGQTPWYSSRSSNAREISDTMPTTDVWGNEDLMRKERERARMNSNDPLAAMKAGVRGLKNAQRERKEWQQQRLRELDDLRRTERSEHKRRRRRRSSSQNSSASLEDFSLDGSSRKHDNNTHEEIRRHSRHRHRRRHHRS